MLYNINLGSIENRTYTYCLNIHILSEHVLLVRQVSLTIIELKLMETLVL